MRRGWLLAAALCCASQLNACALQLNAQQVTTHFKETYTQFANPGQGVFGEPWRPTRFPSSVVYVRFNWLEVEPEDGKFNWRRIDYVMGKAKANHQAVAFRVQTANAHSETYYTSPKWLFDEGCKGFEYTNDGADAALGGKPMTRIEPDYADPIYLKKHAEFLNAFGARYDGSADVEFLDIGSYGIWGEWHTTHPASIAVRQQVVDMYLHAFSKTPLVYMSDDADVMAYALAHGAGLRRDGVGSPWHEQRWAGTPAYANVPAMGDAWLHAPIVFEFYQEYQYMVDKGWSFPAAIDFMLRNHVTMINDDLGKVPKKAMPLLNKLQRLAGYRFVLRQLTEPATAHAGETIDLRMKWANVGVGKLYRPYEVRLSLRDADGDEVASGVAPADPTEWLHGERTVAAKMELPNDLLPGDYTVEIGMMDKQDERPFLHLAMDAPEKDGWYAVGKLTVP